MEFLESSQNEIIGGLQTKVNGMLSEAMASAALATASAASKGNQSSEEAILRVELRKLNQNFIGQIIHYALFL